MDTSYLYSQGDYESLSNELRDINWENKFNKKSVNDCWMLFKNTYNDLVDTFIHIWIGSAQYK
jgi:hypothetical protein